MDKNFIIIGTTASFGAGDRDIYVLRVNMQGDTIWTKAIGGPDTEMGYSITPTHDSGYIVCGITKSFGAGIQDIYLVKLNSMGDTIWTKTLGDAGENYGWCIQPTFDTGFIVVGYTKLFGTGKYDVLMIKTDSNGDTIWAKTYGGIEDDYGYSVKQTADSGYIIVGMTKSFNTGFGNIYLIKTDIDGNMTWSQNFGNTGLQLGKDICQTTDKGYIITGFSSATTMNTGVLLMKTDSAGNEEWSKYYGNGVGSGESVEQTNDGGFILAGTTSSNISKNNGAYLVKTDTTGCVPPDINIGNDTTIFINDSLTLVADSGFASYLWNDGSTTQSILINASNLGVGTFQYYAYVENENGCSSSDTIIVNINCNQLSVFLGNDTIISINDSILLDAGVGYETYLWSDGSTNQTINIIGMIVDTGEHVYSVIVTDSNGCQGYDTIQVKVVIQTSFNQISTESDIKIYPNPASNKLFIEIGTPRKENVIIEIFNLHGKIVYTKQYGNANYKIDVIDLSKFKKGLYVIRVRSNNILKNEKLIIY